MINELKWDFSPVTTAHGSSLGLLCLLSEKEAATPSWCFGAQQKGERGEKCCRRKTAPAKNGTGEKLAPAKNFAGEICGEKCCRRNLQRQMHADKVAVEFYFGEKQILKWRNSG